MIELGKMEINLELENTERLEYYSRKLAYLNALKRKELDSN
jgi:hypothetical protein